VCLRSWLCCLSLVAFVKYRASLGSNFDVSYLDVLGNRSLYYYFGVPRLRLLKNLTPSQASPVRKRVRAIKNACSYVQRRRLIYNVRDYLVGLGSLLHSHLLINVIWLVIMAKVCHYGCSLAFLFYNIDKPGLPHGYFD
jgi:hypothetical protein